MAVTLSAGVRGALTSLQGVTSQATGIQNRLATGKKVNSAVDNPVNYFTAASLNDRSSQLTSLLDGISNGIQTVQAASKGIDGITKLVGSLQSTIKQAQADATQNRPTITGAARATAAEAAVTSKSLKDITLDKKITGADTTADAATVADAGNLGVIDTQLDLAIEITVGSGDPATGGSTYTKNFGSANMTVRDVVNEINKSGVATAFVDEQGKVNVKGTGSQAITFEMASATAAGGTIDPATGKIAAAATDETAKIMGASTTTTSTATSAVRSNLVQQYNDLRTQIDELAKDSGFNGLNLLQGDRLTITFNEKGGKNQSKMEIQGSTISSDNLGLAAATNTRINGSTNFQDDADLAAAAEKLNGALTSLKSLSSTFGANLSVAQTRQDFTKDMSNVLTIGADNLVNADVNAEAASLLALQTRQQLSQTALSLSNQADQGVLRLF